MSSNESAITTLGQDPEVEGAPIVVKFDPAVLVEAKETAGTIVLNPSAEEAIVKLLQLEQQVSDAVKFVKAEIERQGLEVSENFTSVTSDKLKINYSASGAEFAIDEKKRKRYPAELFTTKVTHTPVSAAIKAYRKKNKKWPIGVVVKQRAKSIRISLKEQ
jgi:hypothetical protein